MSDSKNEDASELKVDDATENSDATAEDVREGERGEPETEVDAVEVVSETPTPEEHGSQPKPDEVVSEFAASNSRDEAPIIGFKRIAVHQGADKFAFSFLLVFGFFIIILAKTWMKVDVMIVTGIACLAIIGYGGFALAANRTNFVRMDRAGDNCYYLGLAYTLASLIASLFSLSSAVGSELLGNFGVALVSTATGIIMRLLLMQFRTEIDDFESEARFKLSEASDRYRQQLQTASADIETFQRSVLNSIETVQSEVQDSLKSHSDEMKRAAKSSLTTLEKRINAAEGQLQAFDEKFAALSRYTESLTTAAERLNTQLANFAAHPESVTKTTEVMEENLKRITQAYDDSISQLNENLTLLSAQVSNQSNDFGRAAQSLNGYIDKLDEGAQKLTASTENAQSANISAVNTLTSLVKTLRESLKNG